eukprot:621000-Rhodomonas_salina.2
MIGNHIQRLKRGHVAVVKEEETAPRKPTLKGATRTIIKALRLNTLPRPATTEPASSTTPKTLKQSTKTVILAIRMRRLSMLDRTAPLDPTPNTDAASLGEAMRPASGSARRSSAPSALLLARHHLDERDGIEPGETTLWNRVKCALSGVCRSALTRTLCRISEVSSLSRPLAWY